MLKEISNRDNICPFCKGSILKLNNKYQCNECNNCFSTNNYGYTQLCDTYYSESEIDSTTEQYIETQKICNEIVYKQYLKPLLKKYKPKKVLEVGCGIGRPVQLMLNDGFEAYGIDLPNLAKFWQVNENNPKNFICCSATKMPFQDEYFDFVYSFGVIEHIGTEIGHCSLSKNYKEERQQFAKEILRVTKPNGTILISCPNKTFPIDMLHGPNDSLSSKNKLNKFREVLFNFSGLNIHQFWGKYHLLSYQEVEDLFITEGHAKSSMPLPLKDYFCFCSYQKGYSKKIFKTIMKFYFDNLPKFLRNTFLNPYVLIKIKK